MMTWEFSSSLINLGNLFEVSFARITQLNNVNACFDSKYVAIRDTDSILDLHSDSARTHSAYIGSLNGQSERWISNINPIVCRTSSRWVIDTVFLYSCGSAASSKTCRPRSMMWELSHYWNRIGRFGSAFIIRLHPWDVSVFRRYYIWLCNWIILRIESLLNAFWLWSTE